MFCLCLCLLQTTAVTLELVPANGRRQHSFEKQSGRALEEQRRQPLPPSHFWNAFHAEDH
jgi:hypothetical protein